MAQQGVTIPMNTPGRKGINRQEENAILGPEWLVRGDNCILDSAGRIASRAGWVTQTSTGISASAVVRNVWRYRDHSGASPAEEDIVVWEGGIGNSLSDPEGNSIAGTVTVAAGQWYLQNWNNLCIGFHPGEKPAVYTGTGNFTEIAGAVAGNGVGLAAAGRVWQASEDGTSLLYSDLMDQTTWAAGNILDMLSVWGQTDIITGLAWYNSTLIIFSQRQIVFYEDGQGSELGVDPKQMYVTDQMTGVGCVSHWTIQGAGEEDLMFVSQAGGTSIGRLKSEKSNPTAALTASVRDFFVEQLATQEAAGMEHIRSAYNEDDGYYAVSLPDASIVFYLSMKHKYQDDVGLIRTPVLEWDHAPTALNYTTTTGLLFGEPGEVGKYSGEQDDGTSFSWAMKLGWTAYEWVNPEFASRLKIPKRLGVIVFAANQTSLAFTWAFDFNADTGFASETVTNTAVSEWNIGEWGIAEWSGGLGLRKLTADMDGDGQYIQIGLSVNTLASPIAIQSLNLFTKIGRHVV